MAAVGKVVTCFNCGVEGHYSSACPHPKKVVSATGCRYCKQEGHTAENCESRPVGAKASSFVAASQHQPMSVSAPAVYNAATHRMMKIVTAEWGSVSQGPNGVAWPAPKNWDEMYAQICETALEGHTMTFSAKQMVAALTALRSNLSRTTAQA